MNGTTRLAAAALLVLALCACTPMAATPPIPPAASDAVTSQDLSGIKTYLLDQAASLVASADDVQAAAGRYFTLAASTGFDYTALWQSRRAAAIAELEAARAAWKLASPAYEKMEGIVAGTAQLAQFDVDLDAGAAAAEDPASAVSFDLTLPDGRVLPKPGNLFGITEKALWGTEPAFVAPGVTADWNGDGTLAFGETLPDANLLRAAADLLAAKARALRSAAEGWNPTERDAFTALVVMVPTMTEYFASWRDSRFVAGATSTQGDFVAISRLADIQDILGGLEVVYTQVQPRGAHVDPAQATQVATDLRALKAFVADVYSQEQAGRRYSPEEADTLGAEAQNRATAITGQIAQLAGALGLTIAE
jgi:hypothetical protein